ncbi:MAG: DUF2721 domain-containing protein [Spirochaetes bacterium]|nr:DUF2721 domain-containing protein [Spirochaetota bacterium]
MKLTTLVPALQTAIGPVIVISGVGLLILSMTNRLGRIIDRARLLAEKRRNGLPDDVRRAAAQLTILSRRAKIVRNAIAFASLCILFTSVLIITIFVMALAGSDGASVIASLFIAAFVSLIISLISFLRDINISLTALDVEIDLPGSTKS